MGLIDRFRRDDRSRVVVLGLDGVPHDLLTGHPDRFEHVASIVGAGGAAPIESVLPPESSACWPSLTTGSNPGKTGVYGLLDRDVTTYETYVNAGTDVQIPHMWDRVARAGLAASVLNVPVTHPPQRNLQRMVGGFLAPDVERASYPRSFGRTLRSLDYRIDVDASLAREGDMAGFLDDAYATLGARYEAFAHVIGLDDWDLFVGVFMTPDRVNHFLYGDYLNDGPDREEFLAFYEQLDTYIGAFRSRLPEDVSLVLVSDHGFAELTLEGQVNDWLAETGWLSVGNAPADLRDIGADARAYSLAPGRLYLNLEGREVRGTVPDQEYEVVRDRLREALFEWTTPAGDPVLDRVVPREQLYRGPHVDLAPDLVAVPRDGVDLKASFAGSDGPFNETVRTGMHRAEDAVIATDDPRLDLETATVYDLAPTVLALLGVDFARGEMDGTSLVG